MIEKIEWIECNGDEELDNLIVLSKTINELVDAVNVLLWNLGWATKAVDTKHTEEAVGACIDYLRENIGPEWPLVVSEAEKTLDTTPDKPED